MLGHPCVVDIFREMIFRPFVLSVEPGKCRKMKCSGVRDCCFRITVSRREGMSAVNVQHGRRRPIGSGGVTWRALWAGDEVESDDLPAVGIQLVAPTGEEAPSSPVASC